MRTTFNLIIFLTLALFVFGTRHRTKRAYLHLKNEENNPKKVICEVMNSENVTISDLILFVQDKSDKEKYQVLASIKDDTLKLEKKFSDLGVTASSQIDQECSAEQNCLVVNWASVPESVPMTNVYRCEAKGQNGDETVLALTASARLPLTYYDRFITFREHNGSYYAMSIVKRLEFNVTNADNECSSVGGYLAEVNDEDELRHVAELRANDVQRNDFLFTGGNDLKNRNTFTYYHSGMPVPKQLLANFKQSNRKAKRCVLVKSNPGGGLVTSKCEKREVFLCEIPIAKTLTVVID